MRKVRFVTNRMVWWLGLATWLSCEFEPRANYLARLEVSFCSAPAGVTLQLPCMLHMCASFGDLLAVSQPWNLVARSCWVHTLELFFRLSHTLPLHESHLNTGFLNAELQANWHEIKPTKWLIKFNLTPIIKLKTIKLNQLILPKKKKKLEHLKLFKQNNFSLTQYQLNTSKTLIYNK